MPRHRRRPAPLRSCAAVALVWTLAACADDSTGGAQVPGSSERTTAATDQNAAASGTARRLTFTAADGTQIEYVLLVPEGRAEGEPGKVLLAFPPGGQDIDLAERLVDEKYHDEAIARDYVVVSPAAPDTGLFYDDASAALVPELLDAIAQQYPPDDGRFDLVGVSNGGLSAFRAALSTPERFRSLVVFPGYSPAGADDPQLAKLAGIGVSMFVGGDDSGWRSASERTRATLATFGIDAELHVIDGQGHILGDALPGSELFEALERVRG
jgi:enterochelin esterase-like enzyme